MNYAALIAEHPLPWEKSFVRQSDRHGNNICCLIADANEVIVWSSDYEDPENRARLDIVADLIVEAANRLAVAEMIEWTSDLPTSAGRYWICLPYTEEECKAAYITKIQIREVYQMVGGDESLWVNGSPLAETKALWLWAPLLEPLPPTLAVSE